MTGLQIIEYNENIILNSCNYLLYNWGNTRFKSKNKWGSIKCFKL